MTVIDMIIKLQQLPQNMRVMIDVPHGGESFKFADVVEVEKIQIDDQIGGSEEIIMLSPYELELNDN